MVGVRGAIFMSILIRQGFQLPQRKKGDILKKP